MKKSLLRVLSITILITMLLSVIPFGTTKVKADGVDLDEIRESVFRIVVKKSDGYYIGSGFPIGEFGEKVEYIVTNYHVVEGAIEVYLLMGKDDYIQMFPTNILLAQTDVAVLSLKEPMNFVPLVLDNSKTAKVGDKIYMIGFPGVSDVMDDTFSGLSTDSTVTSGIIGKISTYENTQFYQTDATINGGNSGGPLIDENGYVIGINTFGLSGLNGSIFIDELIHALDVRGYAYETPDSAPPVDPVDPDDPVVPVVTAEPAPAPVPVEKGLSTGMLIAIIALGVVVIGAVVTIILVTGNKNKQVQMANQAAQAAAQQAASAQAAQAAASAQAAAAAASANAVPQTSAMIIGVNGNFKGKSLKIVSKIYIGRNANCHVRFPDGTKGISGQHCSIEFDGKDFYIMDNGSTYGTFVGQGQKLTPRTRYILKNGEQFYLASKEQTFQVSIMG